MSASVSRPQPYAATAYRRLVAGLPLLEDERTLLREAATRVLAEAWQSGYDRGQRALSHLEALPWP